MSDQQLDLCSLAGFTAVVEWVRSSIILHPAPGFFEIEVATDDSSPCSVFMNRANAYLVAFRGRDGIYALADPPDDHARALAETGVAAAAEIRTLALTVSHASLRTLDHVFTRAELQAAAGILNGFTAKGSMFSVLRRPLSLLVCLLAESARSPAIAFEFAHLWQARTRYDQGQDLIYQERSLTARANEAIQCYDKAIRITRYANRLFNDVRPIDRLSRLEKRAAELRELLQSLSAALSSTGNRQLALNNIIRDPRLFSASGSESQVQRLHDMALELGVERGEELTEIVGLCGEQIAMDFARSGVVAPDLTPPRS